MGEAVEARRVGRPDGTAVWGVECQARAAERGPAKIGALNDLSFAHADMSGPALMKALEMAIADLGPCRGLNVEMVSADCQLKANVSAVIARQWWDRDGVDCIADMPSSAAVLDGLQVSAEKRVLLSAKRPDVPATGLPPMTCISSHTARAPVVLACQTGSQVNTSCDRSSG